MTDDDHPEVSDYTWETGPLSVGWGVYGRRNDDAYNGVLLRIDPQFGEYGSDVTGIIAAAIADRLNSPAP